MRKIDASKLIFKKEFEEAGQINVFVPNMRKLYPISRENLILSISNGHHTDKLKTFFTKESILAAKEEPKTKKKNTDEGSN